MGAGQGEKSRHSYGAIVVRASAADAVGAAAALTKLDLARPTIMVLVAIIC